MCRWSLTTVVAVLLGAAAACGGDDGAVSTSGVSTTQVTASTVPASTVPATTASARPDQLFVISRPDLEASATAITEITKKLANSINGLDGEAAAPLTGGGFRAVDPVYPKLGFSTISGYYSYLSVILDTSETVHEVVVNADGSMTRVDWPTFFHTNPAGFDGPMKALRHLLIVDGRVTRLMHLFDQGDARQYAEGISKTIPFASAGIPLEKSMADINAQADAARDLSAQWSAAWTAHDPAAIRALYAETGMRHDEYAGSPRTPADVGVWATRLFAAYPDLSVTVDEAFASGVGPAVLADLTMTVNGSPCTVRVGVVWAIDNQRHIEREDVYYDPATLLACSWVS